MPIVTAYLTSGRSSAEKTALLTQSTEAIARSLNAPLPSIRIVLQDVPYDSTIVAGEMGAEQLLYVVYLIEGRTPELKAALIAGLSEAADSSIGISPDNVRVVVRDVPKTDMGVAGGITAAAAGR